jgi:hypothetical protein
MGSSSLTMRMLLFLLSLCEENPRTAVLPSVVGMLQCLLFGLPTCGGKMEATPLVMAAIAAAGRCRWSEQPL